MIDDENDDISFGGNRERLIGKVIGKGIRTVAKEVGKTGDSTGGALEGDPDEGIFEMATDVLKGIWDAIIGSDD